VSTLKVVTALLCGLILGGMVALFSSSNFFDPSASVRGLREKLYLIPDGRAERDLAKMYETAYRQQWQRVIRGETVQFHTDPIRLRVILYLSYFSNQPNYGMMRRFSNGVRFINKKEYASAIRRFALIHDNAVPHLMPLALVYSSYAFEQLGDYRHAIEDLLILEKENRNVPRDVFFSMTRLYEKLGETSNAEVYRKKYRNSSREGVSLERGRNQ
jgi:hypothetical protein